MSNVDIVHQEDVSGNAMLEAEGPSCAPLHGIGQCKLQCTLQPYM